jgi:hypothetical protein
MATLISPLADRLWACVRHTSSQADRPSSVSALAGSAVLGSTECVEIDLALCTQRVESVADKPSNSDVFGLWGCVEIFLSRSI